jgi:multiple sugar transport system substrate-binding protein
MTKRYGIGVPAEPGRRAVERGIAVCSTAIALILSTSVVVPTVASADPTEITVWRHIGDLKPEMDTFASFVGGFNASQSKWKVKWEELPQKSYADSVNAAALSGTLPCAIDVDGPLVPNFAWSGNVIPLDKYVTPELKADMLPSTIGQYNGHIYGVGQFEASLALWGRKSVMDKFGIRIPKGVSDPLSKEEFDSAVKKVKDSGQFENSIDLFTFYTHEWIPYAYSPLLQSFGGDLIDRSTYLTADGKLNGPEANAWGQWWQNLFKSGYANPKSTDDQAFIQGRAAFAYIGNWYYPNLKKAWGDDLVYMPPPDLGKGPKVGAGSWQWAITKSCANPDGAWAFINYMLSPESIAKISNATGLIPGRTSAVPMTDLYKEGGAMAGITAFPKAFAVIRPPTPAYGNISVKFEEAAMSIANGANVAGTLDDLVTQIDADIKANNGYGFK